MQYNENDTVQNPQTTCTLASKEQASNDTTSKEATSKGWWQLRRKKLRRRKKPRRRQPRRRRLGRKKPRMRQLPLKEAASKEAASKKETSKEATSKDEASKETRLRFEWGCFEWPGFSPGTAIAIGNVTKDLGPSHEAPCHSCHHSSLHLPPQVPSRPSTSLLLAADTHFAETKLSVDHYRPVVESRSRGKVD